MPRIDLTTSVSAAPQAVFDACLDVDLHTASMGSSGERATGGATTGHLAAGDVVTWRARHFGLPWRMTVRITDHERPHRFVDQQTSGPFARWRHEHLFAPDPADPSATIMRDVIEFDAPVGPVGALVAGVILRPYLRRLISRRNAFLAESLVSRAGGTPRRGNGTPP
ncbi:SRPBCC family protein [Micromonospora sp. NPDC023966]|uniref:SRPBCC family protein n=1 Tax=Micromonospora sp. NPDC023966 TaxID=3154699 RepID=UPI0033DB1A8D